MIAGAHTIKLSFSTVLGIYWYLFSVTLLHHLFLMQSLVRMLVDNSKQKVHKEYYCLIMQCSRHHVALFSYPSIYSTAEYLSNKFDSVCLTASVRTPSSDPG